MKIFREKCPFFKNPADKCPKFLKPCQKPCKIFLLGRSRALKKQTRILKNFFGDPTPILTVFLLAKCTIR